MFHGGLNQRLWDRARRAVLRRDHWTCQCGNGPEHFGNEVDHIQALQFGGAAYDLGNLQVLARGCHISKTRAENLRPERSEVQEWRAYMAAM